nr:pentatricopeptide repeat-containing protein At4g02750 [Ipomoea batatas]
MKVDYGIVANSKHYTCMIDLLGRAGRLDDAQDLIKSMPFEPDAATWGALLGASRMHGNTELGEKAAENIFVLEPWNAGMYVLLSNLYAASGRWRDVSEMRLKLRDTGTRKVPGYSWVEVQNKIHIFSVGDSTHPDSARIYAFLEDLELRMKHEGYVVATKLVLHDVDEEEKAHMLKYHSEKLAVAFAILNVPTGRPIRVIKNLRVCGDCHTAIKLISKIVGRSIILRDNNRFHHFNDGICTCGDYWKGKLHSNPFLIQKTEDIFHRKTYKLLLKFERLVPSKDLTAAFVNNGTYDGVKQQRFQLLLSSLRFGPFLISTTVFFCSQLLGRVVPGPGVDFSFLVQVLQLLVQLVFWWGRAIKKMIVIEYAYLHLMWKLPFLSLPSSILTVKPQKRLWLRDKLFCFWVINGFLYYG